jgi:hypothetical protein
LQQGYILLPRSANSQIHRLQLLWSLLAIAEAALKVDLCKS